MITLPFKLRHLGPTNWIVNDSDSNDDKFGWLLQSLSKSHDEFSISDIYDDNSFSKSSFILNSGIKSSLKQYSNKFQNNNKNRLDPNNEECKDISQLKIKI